jgi:hypothetical protein
MRVEEAVESDGTVVDASGAAGSKPNCRVSVLFVTSTPIQTRTTMLTIQNMAVEAFEKRCGRDDCMEIGRCYYGAIVA